MRDPGRHVFADKPLKMGINLARAMYMSDGCINPFDVGFQSLLKQTSVSGLKNSESWSPNITKPRLIHDDAIALTSSLSKRSAVSSI